MGRGKDITGMRSGKLTAIKNVGKDKCSQRLWECLCDCGNVTILKCSVIKYGSIKSCGCSRLLPKSEASFNALYGRYKKGAKRRGYEFTLLKDEFIEITKQNCHYCGAEPKEKCTLVRANGPYKHNGIDRVDNSLGYIIDNCVPCCFMCNGMKRTHTKEEFLAHALRICEHNMETSLV